MRDEHDGDNPFERFDLDPLKGPGAITERMRELAESAPDEATRKSIRAAWEALTLHPARRLRAALSAHPDSHGAMGPPPSSPDAIAPNVRPAELSLADLMLRPSIVHALGAEVNDELPDEPVEEDPFL